MPIDTFSNNLDALIAERLKPENFLAPKAPQFAKANFYGISATKLAEQAKSDIIEMKNVPLKTLATVIQKLIDTNPYTPGEAK